MGFFYTLGIDFNHEKEAIDCKLLLEETYVILSDSSSIKLHLSIIKSISEKSFTSYQLQVYPEGLQYVAGDRKLGERPYFYEIRKQLYGFLHALKLPFNYAYYEFEGGDNIINSDIADLINDDGAGEIQNGDPNAASLFGMQPTYYESKRYLDGLIVSEKIFNEIKTDREHFTVFKEGYFWLSIPLNVQ